MGEEHFSIHKEFQEQEYTVCPGLHSQPFKCADIAVEHIYLCFSAAPAVLRSTERFSLSEV